mgnify:FL=1
MQGDPEANLAHFALQKLKIRAGVLLGLCSANEPMGYEERVFTYGSILVRVEQEKNQASKIRSKGGR